MREEGDSVTVLFSTSCLYVSEGIIAAVTQVHWGYRVPIVCSVTQKDTGKPGSHAGMDPRSQDVGRQEGPTAQRKGDKGQGGEASH